MQNAEPSSQYVSRNHHHSMNESIKNYGTRKYLRNEKYLHVTCKSSLFVR
jgi:hypothetical protein